MGRPSVEEHLDDAEAFVDRREEGPVPLLAPAQRLLGPPLLARVVEDEDDPRDPTVVAQDGGGTVRDDTLGPVLRDEDGVIGEPLNPARREHRIDRIGHGASGRLVEDDEHGVERPAARLGDGPAGQLLGDGVHEDDPAREIGGDDRITDAVEGRGEPLAGCPQARLHVLLLEAFPSQPDGLRDILDVVEDVGDFALGRQDRRVERAPVPLLEAAPGPGDVVFLDGHAVRGPGRQDPAQGSPEVSHAGRVEVLGVVGEGLEEAPAEQAIPRGERGLEVGIAHGDDGEPLVGPEHEVGGRDGFEKGTEVGGEARSISHASDACISCASCEFAPS